MAKQCGTHPFTGKMGGSIGYKVNDEYLERENGSKEGKAFRKDPRRRRTMYYAGLFAQASKAMVLIYRRLPKDQRKHGVYGKLTGKAMSLLRDGKTVEEVKHILTKQYVVDKEPLVVVVKQPAATPTGQSHVVAVLTRPYFLFDGEWMKTFPIPGIGDMPFFKLAILSISAIWKRLCS